MVTCRERKTEVLVIGGGAAGMMASIQAARAGRSVLLVTDGPCASTAILGFNALVSEEDSRELFFQNMIRGGCGLNETELVYAFIDATARAVKALEEMGLEFDKTKAGAYHLLQPLGCSVPRLVHAENKTGLYSMDRMRREMERLGVTVWEHTVTCGLRTAEKRAVGAWAYSKKEKTAWCIRAKAVVLATGGGHMLKGSTYPAGQTGDGYAMGFRAGAKLRDMEFFQHEPCRAVWPKSLGISTTLLAKGGKLTNSLGERFVLKVCPSEGAASKDTLARLIAAEVKAGRGTPHGGVWLDLTDLPEAEIRVNHSLYDLRFRNEGIDLCKERVEVGPAAHSIMGGLRVDATCSTDVQGLFAAGEAMGGLHGANRLGGSAGAEVYVFGAAAGEWAAACAGQRADWDAEECVLEWNVSDAQRPHGQYEAVINHARDVLSRAMGPIRDQHTLSWALEKLTHMEEGLHPKEQMCWEDRIVCWKAENLLLVGRIMVKSALLRRESRGVHFREDCPERDDAGWGRSIFASRDRLTGEDDYVVQRDLL